jgi:hypothetical protein
MDTNGIQSGDRGDMDRMMGANDVMALRQRMVIVGPDLDLDPEQNERHYPDDGTRLSILLADGWRIVRECPHAEGSTILILEPPESEEERARRLVTGR